MRFRLRKFLNNDSGNVMITAAIALPVLVGASGAALDYSTLVSHRSLLQSAADAAALASAKELYISGVDQQRINAVATSVVKAELAPNNKFGLKAANTYAEIVERRTAVRISVSQPAGVKLMVLASMISTDIEVTSTARFAGSGRICVIGLDESASNTVQLSQHAKITAPDCAVYSNSVSTPPEWSPCSMRRSIPNSIAPGGGYGGGAANYSPKPLTDCPSRGDPLESRPEPAFSGCDYKNVEVKNEIADTLSRRVYCGGLKVRARAKTSSCARAFISSRTGRWRFPRMLCSKETMSASS